MTGSAGQQRVQSQFFDRFRVLPLLLAEQRRIAEILDTIDEAIRKTEQVITKLQQMKQGLLHDLLTRGIDENGELRDPERHPEQFQDSPMGRIPKSWRASTLGEVADYVNGFAFKPHHWKKQGLPIIRIAQMQDPNLECDRYPGVVPDRHRIDDGDLLFSWSATLTVLIWNRGPAYVNQHIFKVVPKEDHDLAFVHHLIGFCIDGLAGQSHGTTMKHVKRSDLLPFPVCVPSLAEQRRIAEILDAQANWLAREDAELLKVRTLKHGLMDDLLTGRVRVRIPEDGTR